MSYFNRFGPVKKATRPFVNSYAKFDCLLCLSSVYFSYSDLPFKSGRISIEKGGLAPLPWLRFKYYANFKIFDFTSKTIITCIPSHLVHREMTSMYNLDNKWPVSKKIMPIKIMTLTFSKGVLNRESIPLCFSLRPENMTNITEGHTDRVTYESDKTNDFVLEKIDQNDSKSKGTECDAKGYHVVFKTLLDVFRFCDVCRAPFFIDTKSQMNRVKEISKNIPPQ